MKKTLIALAAVAVSGAAFAQVTLYGVMDVGFINQNSETKFAGGGVNGGSRLGFRVSEDLGGGLKANAVIESAVNTSVAGDAALSGASRGVTGGLSGNFGRIDIGTRNLSANFFATAAVETTGMANYGITGIAGGVRNTKPAIQYTSPTINGFTVRANTVLKDDNAGTSTYQLNVVYANGPLTAAVAIADTGAAKNANFVGAKYNFGPATAHFTQTDSGTAKDRTYGLTAPVAGFNAVLDFKDAANGNDVTLIAATYNLSKSTFLSVYTSKAKNEKRAVGFGIRTNF